LSRCKNCFHSISKKGEPDASCRECNICIRNPEFASKRNFDKKITIEGVTFEAPMDMYITRDRMRYEDYMRMKKILEALATKDLEKRKEDELQQWPKFPKPIILPSSKGYPYPLWIAKTDLRWRDIGAKRGSKKNGKDETSN